MFLFFPQVKCQAPVSDFKWYLVCNYFFLAETNTRTWVGHQHPHQCLCNTGQDCSIAILLGTPPLATQQLLVKAIWQSTKEQKIKGPGLQRSTWLAISHKSTIHWLLMTVLLLHHALRWPAHRPYHFRMLWARIFVVISVQISFVEPTVVLCISSQFNSAPYLVNFAYGLLWNVLINHLHLVCSWFYYCTNC